MNTALETVPKNQPISVGRGGLRKGAGRPKGAETRRTRLIAEKAASEGITPLEYMLVLVRDESKPAPMRLDAAKAAAQYLHPRLSSVTVESQAAPAVALTLSAEAAAAIAAELLRSV